MIIETTLLIAFKYVIKDVRTVTFFYLFKLIENAGNDFVKMNSFADVTALSGSS